MVAVPQLKDMGKIRGHDTYHPPPTSEECRVNSIRPGRIKQSGEPGWPAFAQYHADNETGYKAWAIIVLELDGDRITGITSFLDTERLFLGSAFRAPSATSNRQDQQKTS